MVGAPCGVMDQMTAACGRERDRLLALRCQPAELRAAGPACPRTRVFGIDSGIRHAVSGADYGSVRVGAFMGYRIIAALAGLPSSAAVGRAACRWTTRGGTATSRTSRRPEWDGQFRDRAARAHAGGEFLARYGGITDSVTQVDPGATTPCGEPDGAPDPRARAGAALPRAGSPSPGKGRPWAR